MSDFMCPNCGYSEKPSTNQQRRAYFGIAVKAIADAEGVHKNIMHKALAMAFFGTEDVRIGDKVYKVPATTTGRTRKEMSDYYEFIQDVGAKNYKIVIPDPKKPNESLEVIK